MSPLFSARRPTCPLWLAAPCGITGLLLLTLAALRLQSLAYADNAGRAAVALLFLLCALLAVGLLALSGCDRLLCMAALLPIAAALFLRTFFLDYCSYDYYDFLAKWVLYFRENGGFLALRNNIGNYNVPYLYFLAAFSYSSLSDFYLIKLLSIFSDVLLAWGGLRLCRIFCAPESRKGAAAFCLLFLLPTVVLNGACWAQCDSIYGALLLHALACALDARPGASSVLAALAFSFKLQSIFLLPLWLGFWFLGHIKFRQLLLFPLTYFLSILPALLLGKPLGDILGVYLGQTQEYASQLTLNAPSVYAFLPADSGANTALLSMLGILAAAVLVGALLITLWVRRRQVTGTVLFTAAVILTVGIPFLLPSMHDRYFFLADALTLIWACMNFRRIPQAVLTQVASLGAYYAYLRLQYAFPMAWGAFFLLAALISSWTVLLRQLRDKQNIRIQGNEL